MLQASKPVLDVGSLSTLRKSQAVPCLCQSPASMPNPYPTKSLQLSSHSTFHSSFLPTPFSFFSSKLVLILPAKRTSITASITNLMLQRPGVCLLCDSERNRTEKMTRANKNGNVSYDAEILLALKDAEAQALEGTISIFVCQYTMTYEKPYRYCI